MHSSFISALVASIRYRYGCIIMSKARLSLTLAGNGKGGSIRLTNIKKLIDFQFELIVKVFVIIFIFVG